MMYRNFGGGHSVPSHSYKKGGKALTSLFPYTRLPKGGLRWNNISKGGVMNG